MNEILEKIKNQDWIKITKINEGFDKSEKYFFIKDNKKYILKIFGKEQYERKKQEYEILQIMNNDLFRNIPKPIKIEKVNADNYYYILTWVDGNTISNIKNSDDMYNIGAQLGILMSKIHTKYQCSMDLNKNIDKIMEKLNIYKKYGFKLKNDEYVIKFVQDNVYKLFKQPISIIHGDLTENNIVLNRNNEVGLIDFGSTSINFSYYDFHQVQMYNRFFNILFSVGIIDSYTEIMQPDDIFWECLKIYSAYLSLYKVVWATKQNNNEVVNQMIQRYYSTYEDYLGYSINIPTWYSCNSKKVLHKKLA